MQQERILIRGLNWLGDAIMCLPALHRLREARPEAHISILTSRKLADLWSAPLIDEVITFEKEERFWGIARRLRPRRFTTGLILPTSIRSALELWLAGIPVRVGVDYRGRAPLLTHPVASPADALQIRKRTDWEIRRLTAASCQPEPLPAPLYSHHIYRYLSLVSVLGANPEPIAPHWPVSDQEVRDVLARFALEPDAGGSPLFAMNPGCEYGPAKRWPEDRFIESALALHRKTDCRWLLLGASGDVAACQRIADAVGGRIGEAKVWNLAGKTSLRELGSLLKACSLLLGNDSGPMHFAAAVGTRVVTVFSSTSAAITGPGLPEENKHRLLTSNAPCSPCFRRECPIDMRCMDSLGVDRVVQAAAGLHASSLELPLPRIPRSVHPANSTSAQAPGE